MARTEQISLLEGLLTSATLKGVQLCLFAEDEVCGKVPAMRSAGGVLSRVPTLLLVVLFYNSADMCGRARVDAPVPGCRL